MISRSSSLTATAKPAIPRAMLIAEWNSSHGFKLGQKCQLSAKAGGKPIWATYDKIDFIGRSLISHKVFVELPDDRSKTGFKKVAWYIPSSRFI